MDIIDTIRSDLKGATMERQRQVADGAGVPWSTLRKIVDGDTDSPRYDTVKRLAEYYDRHPPAPPSANAPTSEAA